MTAWNAAEARGGRSAAGDGDILKTEVRDTWRVATRAEHYVFENLVEDGLHARGVRIPDGGREAGDRGLPIVPFLRGDFDERGRLPDEYVVAPNVPDKGRGPASDKAVAPFEKIEVGEQSEIDDLSIDVRRDRLPFG
jgi:hypothetical protein